MTIYRVEVDLGDGEVTLDEVGALFGGLFVGESCVLWEHTTRAPGFRLVET